MASAAIRQIFCQVWSKSFLPLRRKWLCYGNQTCSEGPPTDIQVITICSSRLERFSFSLRQEISPWRYEDWFLSMGKPNYHRDYTYIPSSWYNDDDLAIVGVSGQGCHGNSYPRVCLNERLSWGVARVASWNRCS